jgi:membrane protein YfhO
MMNTISTNINLRCRGDLLVRWGAVSVGSVVLSLTYLLYWVQVFHPLQTFLIAFLYIFPLMGLAHVGLSRWMVTFTTLSPARARLYNAVSHILFLPLLIPCLSGQFSRGITLSSITGYLILNLLLLPILKRDPDKIRRKQGIFRDVGCCLLLVLLVFMSYYKHLRLDFYRLHGDVSHIGYYVNLFLGRNITQGIFPLWNPYHAFGVPSYADPTGQYFFPLYLLAGIFSANYGFYHFIFLAYIFPISAGAIGFFCLVRGVLRYRWIAFITAVGYGFSGFAVYNTQPTIVYALCWLPYLVLFGVKAFLGKRNTTGYVIATGIVYALASVTTYPILWFAEGLHLLLLALIIFLIRRRQCSFCKSAGRVVSIFMIALFLAAPHLIAVKEMLPHTGRDKEISYTRAVGQNALSPRSFMTLFLPGTALLHNKSFFDGKGGGNEKFLDMQNFNAQDLTQRSVYITIPLLIFCLIALARWRRYRGLPLLLGGIAFFYLFASLGGFSFLYEWFFYLIPVYARTRHAAMNRLFFVFYLLLLSAFGLRFTFRNLSDHFLDRTVPRIIGVFLLLFSGYALYLLAAVLPFFEEDLTLYSRLFHDTFFAMLFLGATVILIVNRRSLRYRNIIIAGLAICVIFDALNYTHFRDLFYTKRTSGRYERSLNVFRKDYSAIPNSRKRVKDRTDSDWVHDLHFTSGVFQRASFPGSSRPIRKHPEEYEPYTSRLFFLYTEVEKVPLAETLSRMKKAGGDVVYLSPEDSIPDWFAPAADARAGGLKIIWYAPNKAVVTAKSSQGALLEMADLYYPGWKAFVDGAEVPIYRVNYCFKGVFLPPGSHVVRFVFEPPTLLPSLWLSAFAFLGIIGFYIYRRERFPR